MRNTVNRNGIGGLPDELFPTEGEKSAGNETINCIQNLKIRTPRRQRGRLELSRKSLRTALPGARSNPDGKKVLIFLEVRVSYYTRVI